MNKEAPSVKLKIMNKCGKVSYVYMSGRKHVLKNTIRQRHLQNTQRSRFEVYLRYVLVRSAFQQQKKMFQRKTKVSTEVLETKNDLSNINLGGSVNKTI